MGKWTASGFEAYTVDYYKQQLQSLFTEAFGDDFVLDDSLPQGVLIQRIAELLYNTDMDAVEVLSQLNINTTSGNWLDIIGNMRGLSRSSGSPQIATVSVTSSSVPLTIPADTEFVSGSEVFTIDSNTLISTSPQTISLHSTSNGNSSLQIGDTFSCSITGVTNVAITGLTDGLDEETDDAYRLRILDTYNVTSNSVEYVRAKIAESPYVKTTGVEYNDTSSTVDSRPAHSTEWMAVPRDGVNSNTFNTAVAEIIVNNKTPGAETYGNTTVLVEDMYGISKTVKFTIPTAVNLEMQFTISAPNSGMTDLSNIPTEKENIANYINSLKIHEDVPMSKVMSYLVSDSGFNVTAYKIREVGTSSWTTNSDFTIAGRKYAKITTSNITIGTV